jgi:hypothetical protein
MKENAIERYLSVRCNNDCEIYDDNNNPPSQLAHDHVDLLSNLLSAVCEVHKVDEMSSSLMSCYDSDLCELKSAMSHLMELQLRENEDEESDKRAGVMVSSDVSVIVDDLNSYKMIGPMIEG